MKVKHVLMIAAVLLAMFVAPVVAEDTQQTDDSKNLEIGAESVAKYSFQIPVDFNFASTEAGTQKTDKVSVDITKIDPKNVVEVSVASANEEDNSWYLKHDTGTGYRILYQMTVNGDVMGNNGVVISTADDAEQEVIFTLKESATKSGRYEDTLTFTAQMVEIESDGYTEQAVYTKEALQSAIDAATGETTIVLGADITGDVTVTQKPNVKITIEGNDKKFAGVLTVDGKSQRYETAALTIKNVNFEADSINADAFIRLGVSGDTNTRNVNHVTVENCTFTNTGNTDIVAIKSYTGGDKNVIIDGCTVNEGMHSLAQLPNVEEGLKITDCTVNSVRGISVGASLSLEMSGCTFNVQRYAVRFGSSGSTNTDEKFFTITDSTLKSACTDTDVNENGVVVFRGNSVYSTLTLTDVTLEGTTKIIGNVEGKTTIKTVVDTADELGDAFGESDEIVLGGDIDLNDLNNQLNQ